MRRGGASTRGMAMSRDAAATPHYARVQKKGVCVRARVRCVCRRVCGVRVRVCKM